MVSIHNFTRVSFKFTLGDLKIVDLTGMDVPDQYIWSKSNFKKKMWMNFDFISTHLSAVCLVYNHSS